MKEFKGKAISNGYYVLFIPDHPHSFGRGLVYEHRYLMEQKLGRVLDRKEIVHHIDGNRLNNDISNLELCASIAEHKFEHRKAESNLKPLGEVNSIIECVCGCGKTFLKYDKAGRERKYSRGCSTRVKNRRERLKSETYCKCGCGSKIKKYDKYGRLREYVSGHNAKRFCSKIEIANNTGLSIATIQNYYRNKKLRIKTIDSIESFILKSYGKDYLRN